MSWRSVARRCWKASRSACRCAHHSTAVWIADRNFCTRTIMQGWSDVEACFIVRDYAKHPAVTETGPWRQCGQVPSGNVFGQA